MQFLFAALIVVASCFWGSPKVMRAFAATRRFPGSYPCASDSDGENRAWARWCRVIGFAVALSLVATAFFSAEFRVVVWAVALAVSWVGNVVFEQVFGFR